MKPGGGSLPLFLPAAAVFLEAHRNGSPRNDLPVPGRWARERLDELAKQAEEWLEADEDGGP